MTEACSAWNQFFFPLAVILDSWLAEQKEKSFLFLFLLKYSMLLIRMRERCVFSNLVSFLSFLWLCSVVAVLSRLVFASVNGEWCAVR